MRKVGRNGIPHVCIILGIVLLVSAPLTTFSQKEANGQRFIQITGGLGVSAHLNQSIANYINALTYPSPDQKVSDVSSASEFFVVPEIQVDDEWSVGLEYSYLLKSYSVETGFPWDFTYSAHLTTLFAHYLVPGDGYWLKFGGGIGYAFGNLREQFIQTGAEESSRASGPALKIEGIGNTKFDEHFWGSIGLDLRWVFAGKFKGGVQSSAPAPKLNFFSAGVKFGIMVQM